jgi:integrase
VFDKRVVLSLGDKDVARFQKSLSAKKLSDGTINKIVGHLTTVINYGLKKEIIDYSPFRNIEKIRIDNSRKRHLSKKQIKELYKAVEDKEILKRFILIALNTGARANAILMMKKSDFDLENNKVTIRDMKRRMFYTNPINSLLKSEIEKIKEDGPVIGWAYEKIRKTLKPIYDTHFNVGIDDNAIVDRISSHNLRHTYASHLALNNTPLNKMQKLMNHADIKMTLRYAHLMPDAGEEFVKKLYNESE